jgi:hypothetical protein
LFGAFAEGLEIHIQGTVAVKCAEGVDTIPESLEKVVELRLADYLTVSPQECGGQKADG